MHTTHSDPSSGLPRSERMALTAQFLSEAKQAGAGGDDAARKRALDRVVMLNLGVARSLASRHRGKGVPLEDLEQVAYLALVRAARQFDVDRRRNFLTYAVPTIRGELKKYFRDNGWMVRPPRRTQEIQSRVVAARDDLHRVHARPPTHDEIADSLGLEVDDVAEALRAEGCFHPSSLDRPVGAADGGTTPLGDLLADEDDRDRDAAEARLMLRPVVRRLRRRDQRILRLRFFEGRTQQEIADDLGVTQMQVSRLLARILGQLRAALNGADGPEDRETTPATTKAVASNSCPPTMSRPSSRP